MCSDGDGRGWGERLDGLDGAALLDLVGGALRRLGGGENADPGADALLDVVEQALDVLGAQVLGGGVGDAALSASVTRLHRLETRVHAEKLRRVAEVDTRQAYRGQGRDTADLLARQLGLTRGEAHAQADTAAALAQLPQTAAKLRRGELGVAQAREAARRLSELDRLAQDGVALPDGARGDLDGLVADNGPRQDRRQLSRTVDQWAHALAPDALAQRERRARAQRRLWVGPRGSDGMVAVEGLLDPVGGAHLQAALDALSRASGPADTRTRQQRQADALVDLARGALDGAGLPQVAAQRPHVILITRPETLHGHPGTEPAHLDGIGAVSPATARQLCCDAQVTTVVTDRNSAVLDVGRSRRDPTPHQRAAVIARDRGCVGCGAPVGRCQIHHIRWWSAGGPTDVDNLCLLCWDCHHHVHHDRHDVTRTPDGRYSIEPAPAPQRHSG